jgi:hypothetical protein
MKLKETTCDLDTFKNFVWKVAKENDNTICDILLVKATQEKLFGYILLEEYGLSLSSEEGGILFLKFYDEEVGCYLSSAYNINEFESIMDKTNNGRLEIIGSILE